ncbi:hypothetical protein [Mycobacterium sp. AZCC_0083]|uniref:hypothetical protein n=1 Tax=Mycobacterium sp. AZCC_0083 TaxID=2735882 RepID=UPI0016107C02|nr:hypothetical protein [Mycobacterium sp. AZCC_0083]MBB5168358.1 hypothetical protein [Mycobacterium sp. AZCC_0083]
MSVDTVHTDAPSVIHAGLLTNFPRENVAQDDVVAAQNGRRRARRPMPCDAPRRAAALALTGVPHRTK